MKVRDIYEGSDGEATKALYAELQQLGAVGVIALNLFRAQKASVRAKVYRGGNGYGSFRSQAYDKKNWSLSELCKALEESDPLNFAWGWKEDPGQEYHKWVLYVDLPSGQVSFHSAQRLSGPDYTGEWDGIRGVSDHRIIAWVQKVLDTNRKVSEGGQ